MTTKVKLNEVLKDHSFHLGKDCVSSNLKNANGAKCTTFNVMHSSEITKVLRELTQCVASEHDLLVPCKHETVWNEHCTENGILDTIPRSDISCSEVSGSTTTNCSQDLNQERTAGQTHVCGDCGKHFSKKDFLQKHRIVHEEPRHRCAICEKSFVREDKLKRHFVSIHSKHRPHICVICAKAFARKDKLKDHQKHHLTASNNFLCLECHIPFVQKSDLNRHTRGAHKAEDSTHSGQRDVPRSHTASETHGSTLTMTTAFLPVLAVHTHTTLSNTITMEPHPIKTRKSRPKRCTRQPRVSGTCVVKREAVVQETVAGKDAQPPQITTSILYPPLSLITQPIRSVPIPGQTTHYPGTSSSSPSLISSSLPYSSSKAHSSSSSSSTHHLVPWQYSTSTHSSSSSYNYPLIDPMISTVLSLTPTDSHSHSHSHNNNNHHQSLKTHHTSMFLAHHNNLCHVQPSPLRYYHPYLQQTPPQLVTHSIHPQPPQQPPPPPPSLTANIYPYLPF